MSKIMEIKNALDKIRFRKWLQKQSKPFVQWYLEQNILYVYLNQVLDFEVRVYPGMLNIKTNPAKLAWYENTEQLKLSMFPEWVIQFQDYFSSYKFLSPDKALDWVEFLITQEKIDKVNLLLSKRLFYNYLKFERKGIRYNGRCLTHNPLSVYLNNCGVNCSVDGKYFRIKADEDLPLEPTNYVSVQRCLLPEWAQEFDKKVVDATPACPNVRYDSEYKKWIRIEYKQEFAIESMKIKWYNEYHEIKKHIFLGTDGMPVIDRFHKCTGGSISKEKCLELLMK